MKRTHLSNAYMVEALYNYFFCLTIYPIVKFYSVTSAGQFSECTKHQSTRKSAKASSFHTRSLLESVHHSTFHIERGGSRRMDQGAGCFMRRTRAPSLCRQLRRRYIYKNGSVMTEG